MATGAAPEGPELDELVARIDAASEGMVRAIEVHDRLSVTADENETPAAAAAAAFMYAEPAGRRDNHGLKEFFRPMGGYGDIVNPPHIRDMPAWVTETWELCAGRVTAPMARARLHDLCFVAGLGQSLDHICAAVTAYLEVGDYYLNGGGGELGLATAHLQVALGATHALARALELARATHQDDLADAAVQKLVEAAGQALDDHDGGPGVVLGFIDPLAHDSAQPAELDDLLARARERYLGDMWNTNSTIELELARPGIDNETRERLRGDEVEAMLTQAETAPPMNALLHRQAAAQLARTYELTYLYERAVNELQDMRGEDLGMVQHKVDLSIPAEFVEQFIGQFVNAPTWQEGLKGLVSVSPPSGQLEANLQQVAELPTISPLLSIIAVTQIGPDGLPRKTSSTDEERAAYHLAEAEIRHMQVFGGMYVEGLKRIGERWSPIDEEELTDFFGQQNHVATETAAALARGFLRFFGGDHEGATFSVVPRIERLARDRLMQMGAAVYKPAKPTAVGQYSGLGVLLQKLEDRGLDPSWGRFLGTLLTRAEGSSFRNHLLHGAVDDPSVGSAGLTLIAALYLAVGVRGQSPVPGGSAGPVSSE
jgi:hypothetical protein